MKKQNKVISKVSKVMVAGTIVFTSLGTIPFNTLAADVTGTQATNAQVTIQNGVKAEYTQIIKTNPWQGNLVGTEYVAKTFSEDFGTNEPFPGVGKTNYSVTKTAFVVIPVSGQYNFRTQGDDRTSVKINGVQKLATSAYNATDDKNLGYFHGGDVVEISQTMENDGSLGFMALKWGMPNLILENPDGQRKDIPLASTFPTREQAEQAAAKMKNYGVLTEYYDGTASNVFKGQVVEPESFTKHYGSTEPYPGVGTTDYAVKKTGYIYISETGNYRFNGGGDDYYSLSIDGKELIKNLKYPNYAETGSIYLEKGATIKIEQTFVNEGGEGYASLRWTTPSQPAYSDVKVTDVYESKEKALEVNEGTSFADASEAVNNLFTNKDPNGNIKSTLTQAEIDAAQALINKVTDPTKKATLQADLNKAQSQLDAKNAASAAEKANQDAAKKAVDELFNNNTSSSNTIKPVTDQVAIDAAQALVNKVTDPAIKAALQADVDKAQSLLDAKNAATAAEKAKQDAARTAVNELFNNNTPSSNAIKPLTDQVAIDAAQALVNKVTDPTVKAALQADVDKAQNLLDAKNAATAAEKAKQDVARTAVNELFNNNAPSSNAIKPVTDQVAIDVAQALVNKVTDPTTKAALQADVDKAQQLLNNSVLAKPQLNPMTEADTVFSGKLDVSKYNPGTIRIYINNTPATVVAVDANGNFSYNIGNRKSGDVISVDYKDRTGQYNPTTKTSITVASASSNVTINKMTENDDTIIGKTAPNAKVRYVVNGQAVNVGYADASGNYTMYIGKQKTGTVVGVEVFDPATSKYKAAVTTTVAAVNVTIQPMTNANDTVTGTAPANAKLRFLINGTAVNIGTADASGNYSKFVGTQIAGTTVAVEMLNPDTGKYELAKTATVTGAPKSVNYTVSTLTTVDDTLSGTAPANAKLRFSINGNLISVITADASGNYSKFIGKQKDGAVISVELLNENTNQYTAPQSVTVATGTGNATLAPVINTITEGQGVVTGTVPASIVQVRVWINGVAQTMVSATNGDFTWVKANLKAGDTVKVDYKDATGTWISTEKIVTK
ncbi:toxin Cry1Ac domain D-VI-related protein [Listeria booriae]|uniref:PA14 domain-containing protein n=1 Tax=Listeria booriae TaxID=1552123 RepID=A0A841ZWY1_9LIST|nr:toxin Cry1Ac domain D-VI-related protein [Listeria booriae]MBC1565975.1 hypothetical protein [Listeria booriae]